MKQKLLSAIVGVLLCAPAGFAASTDDVYLLGPDSLPHDGVPKGKVIGPLTLASDVFTNTTRHYWIYIPAQYDPAKPACLMIFQDGHAFVGADKDYRAPNVFDNLIYRREMPVTVHCPISAVFFTWVPPHGQLKENRKKV